MQSFSPAKLLLLGISVLIAAVAVAEILVRFGNAFPRAHPSLALSMAVIGIGAYAASLPIASYRKAREKLEQGKRPNSFRAFRILVFARATIITAVGFVGWFAGQLLWLLLFGNPVESLLFATLLALGSSTLMLLLGFLAEWNCRAPKDPDGEAKS